MILHDMMTYKWIWHFKICIHIHTNFHIVTEEISDLYHECIFMMPSQVGYFTRRLANPTTIKAHTEFQRSQRAIGPNTFVGS